MKQRADRLRRILALAATEERRLAAQTGRSQARLNEQRARLLELHQHRRTYGRRTPETGNLPAAHWKDYQRFLGRLDQAVRSQQQIITDCERSLDLHRRRWQVKRQRVESLQQVVDRAEAAARRDADRREQRTLDDLPAGRHGFEPGCP